MDLLQPFVTKRLKSLAWAISVCILIGFDGVAQGGRDVASQKVQNSRYVRKKMERNLSIEIQRLVSQLNALRTRSQYVEFVSKGLSINDRQKIRAKLKGLKKVPRARFVGRNTFDFITAGQKNRIKVLSLDKQAFAINGKVWKFSRETSRVRLFDDFIQSFRKSRKRKEALRQSVNMGTADAAVPVLLGVKLASFVILRVAPVVSRAYRGWKMAAPMTATAIGAGNYVASPSTGGARGVNAGLNVTDKAAEKSAKKAKKEAKKWAKYRAEQLIKAQIKKEIDQQVNGKGVLRRTFEWGAGLLAAGGAVIFTGMSYSSITKDGKSGEGYFKEMFCQVKGVVAEECDRMSLDLQTMPIKKKSEGQKSTEAPLCPTEEFQEFISITRNMAENRNERFILIRFLGVEGGKPYIHEHIAYPSVEGMGVPVRAPREGPGGGGTNSIGWLNGSLPMLTGLGPKIEKSEAAVLLPHFQVSTKASRRYNFDDQGRLQSIEKMGFKEPFLEMENLSTSPPFLQSLIPNVNVPESDRAAYYDERKKWWEQVRDKSLDEISIDRKKTDDSEQVKAREEWDARVVQAKKLYTFYQEKCLGEVDTDEVIVETVEPVSGGKSVQ